MKSIYLLIGFVSLFFMSCVRDGEELDSTATEGSMDSSEMLVTTRSGGSDLLLMPQNLNFTKSVIGYVHPGYSY